MCGKALKTVLMRYKVVCLPGKHSILKYVLVNLEELKNVDQEGTAIAPWRRLEEMGFQSIDCAMAAESHRKL